MTQARSDWDPRNLIDQVFGGRVAVRTSGPVDLAGLESELVTGLRQVGLAVPTVSVSVVESLQRNAAGS